MSMTNFQRFVGLLLLAGGIVLLALAANHASATILTVDDDGNAEYTKIQDAIDAANEGDTIRVWEGTYFENVVLNKTVNLVGNGSEETTIDGGGEGDVVKINADWVNMSGFTATGSGNGIKNSGIKVGSNFTSIFDNVCSDNSIGIYIDIIPASSKYSLPNGNFKNGWMNWTQTTNVRDKNDGHWERTTIEHGDWMVYDGPTAGLGPEGGDNVSTSPNGGKSCDGKLVSDPFQVPADSNFLYFWHHAKWYGFEVTSDNFQDNYDDMIILRVRTNSTGHVVDEIIYRKPPPGGEEEGRLQFDISDYKGELLVFEMELVTNYQQYDDGLIQIDDIKFIQDINFLIPNNNSILNNTISGNKYSGIYLRSTNNNTISGNTCINNDDHGIYLRDSNYNKLSYNTCSNNSNGILLENSRNNTLSSNVCSDNIYYGIQLNENCDHNIISDNYCSSNDNSGIHLWYSDNASVMKNTCESNNENGISLSYANNNHIKENTCESNFNGLTLTDSYENEIMNNIFKLNEHRGISQQSGSGNILNFNICESNEAGGISLTGTKNTITNNTCSNSIWSGISVGGNYNTITRNTCSKNTIQGISIGGSHNTIDNNICTNNDRYGIFLGGSNNTLRGNTISNNDHGMSFKSSNDNILTNNTIIENGIGIYLIDSSENNTAYYNNIYNNTEYGINATDNDGCTINATYNWWGDPNGPYHPVNNTDGEGDNVTDYVLFDPWLSEPVNRPPTANAGDDQTVYANEEVRFVGTGEDPEGTIEKYEWDFDGDGTFDWSSSTTGETTHMYTLEGSYHPVLRVTDDDGATVTDGCTITVKEEPVNEKPTITITEPANNSTVSGTVTINGTASDPNGDETIERVEISINHGGWIGVTGTTSWSYEWDTKGYEDGEYEIQARAFDGEEYSDGLVWNLIVDNSVENIRPLITITAPENKSEVSGVVVIEGTSSDEDGNETIEKVEIKINHGDWTEVTGTTSWSYEWDTTTGENGEYSLKFKAFDGEEFSEIKEIILDVQNVPENTRPNISITSPANNSEVTGTVTINGTASDPDGNETIEKVVISIDGGAWIEATGTISWNFQWDTAELDNGEYSLRVRAFDGEEFSGIIIIIVDLQNVPENNKPVIIITYPANNPNVSGVIQINGTASDVEGNDTIQKVEIIIGDGEWKIVDGTSKWSYWWDTTDVQDGEVLVRARAFDGTDFSEVKEIVLNVQNPSIPENKPPTVSITSPKDGDKVSGEISIKGTASDEDGNDTIEKVDISINEEAWITVTDTALWTFEWNTEVLANGDYTIRVRCYDGQNYSDVVSITVTVENKDDDGDGNLLFEQIGPLPLIGYIGIVIFVVVVGIAGAKKKRGKTGGGMAAGATSLHPPVQFPGPSSPPTQLPYQQQPQYPPTSPPTPAQPPQQPPTQYVQPQAPQQYPPQAPMQYVQPQVPQQYPPQAPVPPAPASPVPSPAGSTWICPGCGDRLEEKFLFCMKCGNKR